MTTTKRPRKESLVAIKKRLRAGKLTKADIAKLGRIVNRAEIAAADLRAAVIE